MSEELYRSDILSIGEWLKNRSYPDHIVESFSGVYQPNEVTDYEDAILLAHGFSVKEPFGDTMPSTVEDEPDLPAAAIDFKKIGSNKYEGLHDVLEPIGTEALDAESWERTTRAREVYFRSRARAQRQSEAGQESRNEVPEAYRRERVRLAGQKYADSTVSEESASFANVAKERILKAQRIVRTHALATLACVSLVATVSSGVSVVAISGESILKNHDGDIYAKAGDAADADAAYAEADNYKSDEEKPGTIFLGTLLLDGAIYVASRPAASKNRK